MDSIGDNAVSLAFNILVNVLNCNYKLTFAVRITHTTKVDLCSVCV